MSDGILTREVFEAACAHSREQWERRHEPPPHRPVMVHPERFRMMVEDGTIDEEGRYLLGSTEGDTPG